MIDSQLSKKSDLISVSHRIALWERIAIWLVLVGVVVFTFVPQMYLLISNWTLAIEGLRSGAIRPISLVMPFLPLAAAVLLVRRNKWCLPLFIVHLVGSIAFIAYYYGLSAMPWYFFPAYILEVAVVSLTIQLLGRGILK